MWSVEALAGTCGATRSHQSASCVDGDRAGAPVGDVRRFGSQLVTIRSCPEGEASARAHTEAIGSGHEDGQLRHGTSLGIRLQARDNRLIMRGCICLSKGRQRRAEKSICALIRRKARSGGLVSCVWGAMGSSHG